MYEPQLSLFKLCPHAEVDVEVETDDFSYFFVSYSEKTNFVQKTSFFRQIFDENDRVVCQNANSELFYHYFDIIGPPTMLFIELVQIFVKKLFCRQKQKNCCHADKLSSRVKYTPNLDFFCRQIFAFSRVSQNEMKTGRKHSILKGKHFNMYHHTYIEYDSESENSIFQILCQDSKILKKFCLSFCSYYFYCFLLFEVKHSNVFDEETYRKKEYVMEMKYVGTSKTNVFRYTLFFILFPKEIILARRSMRKSLM
jgi:hypothetical protein